jgi:two-component system alkaline phosphatase synthesis response regulator PhoP
MLSAKDSVSDKVLSLDYGADDYITKPFENIELLARINALKRRYEQSNPNINQNGNVAFHHLVIDTANRQVLNSGEPLPLTPKEYDLLIYFSQNAGQSLQRDKIIGDLWGNDALYKWSRSLDVHVQNLRQKIEVNPKNPEIIKTVSGVGYKIK